MVIVLMGVSGAGKTTVGERLAAALGAELAEGDSYHPPENVAKMRGGTPLDDADRWPWLEILSREIDRWLAAGQTVVLTCSALKQRYRNILKGGRDGVRFVHLRGPEALIRARLAERRGHYMPASLLTSQLAALEPPADAITVAIEGEPEEIAAEIVARLRAPCSPANPMRRASMSMVHVLAIITTKPGMRAQVLAAFNSNVPNVHDEDGCIEYGATFDAEDAGAIQTKLGDDTFVVVEKWASLDALKAHAAAPHMAAYGVKVKDMLASRIIHVLSPA